MGTLMRFCFTRELAGCLTVLLVGSAGTAGAVTPSPQVHHIQAMSSADETERSLLDRAISVEDHAHGDMHAMCKLPAGVDHAAVHDGLPGTAPVETLQRHGMVQPRLQVMRELMESRFGNRPN